MDFLNLLCTEYLLENNLKLSIFKYDRWSAYSEDNEIKKLKNILIQRTNISKNFMITDRTWIEQ